MPESLDQNHAIAFLSDSPDNREAEEDACETVAFLPPMVSRLLIAGWILLFAGRWLIVQGMYTAGLLAPELVETLDDRLLGPCYLLLLSVTLVTLVVRIVRGRNSQPDPLSSKMDFNAQAKSASADVGAVEAESSDRGGKQT